MAASNFAVKMRLILLQNTKALFKQKVVHVCQIYCFFLGSVSGRTAILNDVFQLLRLHRFDGRCTKFEYRALVE